MPRWCSLKLLDGDVRWGRKSISDYDPRQLNSQLWNDFSLDLLVGGSPHISEARFLVHELIYCVYATKNISFCRIPVPYHMIAISLASFAVPLSLGVLFKYKRPQKADRLAFLLSRPFFLLCLLVIPVLAMSQSTFVFYLLTWRHALSGFLVGEIINIDK